MNNLKTTVTVLVLLNKQHVPSKELCKVKKNTRAEPCYRKETMHFTETVIDRTLIGNHRQAIEWCHFRCPE